MSKKKWTICLIVATKDRPSELRQLLRSLTSQTVPPAQVVIVDSSAVSQAGISADFPSLRINYVRSRPPSASRQRNEGLRRVAPGIELVGFADDDAVFEPEAVAAMIDFWNAAGEDVGGASFNMVNHPSMDFASLKRLPLTERWGLYSARPGAVARSGFQTTIGCLPETRSVQWIPTTAAVWRREIVDRYRFDEWFREYSYLEDLDFSYRIGRENRLVVVAGARYYHFPAPSGRGNDFQFGRREVKNRLYFVAKHPEMSAMACYAALALRIGISLWFLVRHRRSSFARRAAGNILGLAEHWIGPRRRAETPGEGRSLAEALAI